MKNKMETGLFLRLDSFLFRGKEEKDDLNPIVARAITDGHSVSH
jgi:hypothetical protein